MNTLEQASQEVEEILKMHEGVFDIDNHLEVPDPAPDKSVDAKSPSANAAQKTAAIRIGIKKAPEQDADVLRDSFEKNQQPPKNQIPKSDELDLGKAVRKMNGLDDMETEHMDQTAFAENADDLPDDLAKKLKQLTDALETERQLRQKADKTAGGFALSALILAILAVIAVLLLEILPLVLG